jgi:putative NADH-flavin reductase
MKIFLLGATGGTGRAVLEQALARGHEVTALVRSPEKITIRNGNLSVHAGDPTNADQIAPLLAPLDIVITALGHRGLERSTLLEVATKSLVQAMQTSGTRRVLLVSLALLFPEVGNPVLTSILRFVLRNNITDSREMERIVTQSDLDWTIARPPRLTNGPKTEKYRVADGELPRGGGTISRADLAHFLLDEAARHEHVRKIAGLCY